MGHPHYKELIFKSLQYLSSRNLKNIKPSLQIPEDPFICLLFQHIENFVEHVLYHTQKVILVY